MIWDKPKVEVAVQIVERWILARLRHHTFLSLADLNRAISRLLEDLNHRPFKKLPGTRRSQYEALDLPALLPLPAEAYEFAVWKQARVHLDYHVEVNGHYYSVPYQLVTRQLDVRITALTIECFHQNQRAASHVRSDQRGHTTIAEHMPSHHRAQSEWNPGRFLNWAVEIGPYTRDFRNVSIALRHLGEKFRLQEEAQKLRGIYSDALRAASCSGEFIALGQANTCFR